MYSAVPEISDDMRSEALAKAMEMRRSRSEFRAKLKSGEISPVEAIELRHEPFLMNMRVKLFIQDIPGYGVVKAERLMQSVGISETRRMKGLGRNQIEALKTALSRDKGMR